VIVKNSKDECEFKKISFTQLRSLDSSVSTATDYGLEGLGLIPGSARFSLPHTVQIGSEAHPALHPIDAGALPLEVKRQGLGN
jgi:hypothetical protein